MASDVPPPPDQVANDAAEGPGGHTSATGPADSETLVVDSNPELARSRLIDHFKRAYQIIVGLAIAQACVKVLPHGFSGFPDLELWLFATFFVTVVPIFHGGDRSLDIKYLDRQPKRGRQKAAYVWDVYILLITAILFVKVAQAIPGPGEPQTAQAFYVWMMVTLFFDAVILVIDDVKTSIVNPQAKPALASYLWWIGLNVSLAVICSFAASLPSSSLPSSSSGVVAAIVFGCALARTIADYWLGRSFLFP